MAGVNWSAYVGHHLDDDEPPPVCGRKTAEGKCLAVLRWDGEGYWCPACDGTEAGEYVLADFRGLPPRV